MRIDLRRGRPALVLAVLTMAVSLSERAQAQQGGLFPLAPIRRERPPCSNEDPVYKYYKQRYFGYHPTCWTPFPAGWGCPSKETADKEKAFREQPLDSKPAMEEEGPLPGEDMGQPRGGPIRPNVPDTPPERDPFLDNDMPGAAPLPRPNAQPRRPAQGGASPFEDLNNPGASTTPARRNSRGRTVAPIRNDDAPELSAPTGQPETNPAERTAATDASPESLERGNQGPLLAVEDLNASRAASGEILQDSQPMQPTNVPSATTTNPAPAPRRGLISNLFGGLGLNWMRR